MALVINQGVQDTTQDGRFEILEDTNVLTQVVKLKLADATKYKDTIEVSFRILSGKYRGRYVFDKVCYDPSSNMSWKYRALRKAAGSPYVEGEPTKIDIEKLLLNKAVYMDLEKQKYTDKKTNELKDAQKITYKEAKPKEETESPAHASVTSSTPSPAPTPDNTDVEFSDDTGDDELPVITNGEPWEE